VRARGLLTAVGIGLVLAGCAAGPAAAPPPGRGTDGAAPGPAPGVAGPGGKACSPAVTIDGYSDVLDKTYFAGTYVGNLSSLAVDTDGSLLALSDRSALFNLDARTYRPSGVVALADESGRPLDSEGLAVDRDGQPPDQLGGRAVGGPVRPGRPAAGPPARAGQPARRPGRPRLDTTSPSRGSPLQPDGRALVASMEAALTGDQGNLVRFQTWTRAGAPGSGPGPGAAAAAGAGEFGLGAEYGYPVDAGLGVSEIRATGDGRLLVLERGYVPGIGNTIRLYLADPNGASERQRRSGADPAAADPADPQDAAGGPRALPHARRDRPGTPGQPAAGQRRGPHGHRPRPGRRPAAATGQRRQPEHRPAPPASTP